MSESKNNPSLILTRETWATIQRFLLFQLDQEVERNLSDEDQVFAPSDLTTIRLLTKYIDHMLRDESN